MGFHFPRSITSLLRWLSFLRERFADATADNHIFSRLQHPDADHQRVRVRMECPGSAACPVLGFSSIDGLPSRSLVTISVVVTPGYRRIEPDQQVGNVVGDLGDDRLGGHGGDALHRSGNQVRARFW